MARITDDTMTLEIENCVVMCAGVAGTPGVSPDASRPCALKLLATCSALTECRRSAPQ
jgi:hypothetical protein